MIKRLRWMVLGAGVAASAQAWAKRRFRRFLTHYTPPQVAGRAAATARAEWRAAVSEGKAAMREREDQLRTPRRLGKGA